MRTLKGMIVIVLLSFLPLSPSSGADATTSKDVNKLIRNAQSLYYKGKAQAAHDALEKAKKTATAIMAGSDDVKRIKLSDWKSGLARRKCNRMVGYITERAAPPDNAFCFNPGGRQVRQ